MTTLRPAVMTYSVAPVLPAGVGGGVNEPSPGRPWPLGRLGASHPLVAEEPGQPRR